MSEWRDVPVAALAAPTPNSLATGPFGSSIGSRFFQSSGVPVLRGSNLSEDVGDRLIEADLVFVSEEKANEFARSEVRRGDLVFTCWGTIGQVGLIDKRARYDRYIVSNKQMKLTPDPAQADSLFLYYCFSGPVVSGAIKGQAIGSSVPGFNLGQLRNIKILLPPLEEQRRIAALLGALDDKLDLNRRMNQTLEALAQTLFKSWFVDFDPVRAKAEGRQPEGVDAETAGLFPSAFERDLRGECPIGWNRSTLASETKLMTGGTPSTAERTYWGGNIPWFSVKDAPDDGQVWVLDTEKSVTQSGIDNSAAQVLPVRTTIISARGTVGKLALTGRPMAMNQSCYGLTGVVAGTEFFTHFLVRESVEGLKQNTHGTVFDTITRDTFAMSEVVVPPPELRRRFDSLVEPLLERARSNLSESVLVGRLRDLLLPKLLSGEIRLADAEAFVARAV